MTASAVPSSPWYVAAAGTGARRIDRSPAVLPQSFEPKRLCVGRRMAAGRVAIERSLSAARNIRRAGLGEDSSIKAPQSAGRSQCGTGQSVGSEYQVSNKGRLSRENLIRFDCVAESHNVSEIIGHGKQRLNDEIERRS